MKPITILLGKSASGKTTIANYLIKKYGYNKIIEWTTRPIRKDEKNGIDYYFVNKNIFSDEIIQNYFIEYRIYNTLKNNKPDQWYYGLHKKQNNISLLKQNILITTYDACIKILNYFGKNNCEIIYIDVPNKIRLERAKKRNSYDEKEFLRRMKADDKDFNWNKIKGIVDKKIINVGKTLEEICKEIVK